MEAEFQPKKRGINAGSDPTQEGEGNTEYGWT